MTNHGWLFKEAHAALELVEVDEPTPGHGEVVLDVVAAGLCHSDIGIIEGLGTAWTTHTPIVLGHEVAGTIRTLGEGVDGFKVGDRVAIALMAHGDDKKTGLEAPGLSRNGGFQHRCIAQASELVLIPDGVSMEQGAAATDSVVTAYHAVKYTAEVSKDMIVGVVGMGGLGLNAVQVALSLGAIVHGVDINEGARKKAEQLGVASTHSTVMELMQFNPDIIFDFAGFGTTTADAIMAVKVGGKVILVGLGVTEGTIPSQWLVMKGVQLIGSAGGSKQDLKDVLAMLDDGTITNTITEVPFADLPKGVKRLTDGEVVGRLVIQIGNG